jgi:cytochrome c oxidase subunit 3
MKVGSIETFEEKQKDLIKNQNPPGLGRSRGRSGGNDDDGSGGNGGGGGNRSDGNDKKSDNDFFDELNDYPSNKFRIGTGFLILVVLMTFSGLIGAYIVISTNKVAEWQPFSLPIPIWISTGFIIISSFTFLLAHNALNKENQEKAKIWLLITTILGGMFIASQLVVWMILVREGVYLQSNPYAGFFYLLTAIHALHVIGGIIALGYIVIRTWKATTSKEELSRRKTYSNAVSWYWHFMDGLWLVLLVLLGFWK